MLFQLNSRLLLLEMLDSHYYKIKYRDIIVVMTIYFSKCGIKFGQNRLKRSNLFRF